MGPTVRLTSLGVASSIAALASLGACAGTPSPAPPSVDSAPTAALPAPVASVAPSASAPAVAATLTPPPEPPPVALPEPPSPTVIDGAAAIVWVQDDKARDRVRSTWIERDGDRARVVATREGLVFAGRKELWTIATRPVSLKAEKCSDPNTACPAIIELDEPQLKSLATERTHRAPWRSIYEQAFGCDHTASVDVDAMVGPFVFARTWTSDLGCGGSCPMHSGGYVTFDVDTGKTLELRVPGGIEGPMRDHLRATLPDGALTACPEDLPLYRISGAYAPDGALQGIYAFGDSQSGLCGTAPMCSNPDERVAWIPSTLAPWGKLPPWVAAFLAVTKSEHAVMIPEARVEAARKEFGRVFKEGRKK